MREPALALKRIVFGVVIAVIVATGAHVNAPQASAAIGPADDRQMSTATSWWTYNGITADQLTSHLAANGARPTDIQVESSEPRFSVVMVRNAGSYQADYWWWYYGQTEQDVNSHLVTNNARPISISAYDTPSGVRYAVVMVKNAGANAKKNWWYHGSADFISGRLAVNHARLIEIGPSPDGFVAIMVDNTAGNSVAWWWYHGIPAKQVRTYLTMHGARPIDISRNPGGGINVVMYASTVHGDSFAGRSPSAMLNEATSRDERIVSIFSYNAAGTRLQAAAMVKNTR
jgi:hypothetical protein